MNRLLIVAVVLGVSAVALGAFGAHGLQSTLQTHGTAPVWQTAAQYHFYHALAVLVLALAAPRLIWPALLWTGGVIIFCGSLYILAVTGMTWLGRITPIGGVLFILGWLALLLPRK